MFNKKPVSALANYLNFVHRTATQHVLDALNTGEGSEEYAHLQRVIEDHKFTGKGGNAAESIDYSDPLANDYYLARYVCGYALEYKTIFEIVLMDVLKGMDAEGDPIILEAESFGCGSMVEAWGLAYVLERLRVKRIPGVDRIRLRYQPVDLELWPRRFLSVKANVDGTSRLYEPLSGEGFNSNLLRKRFETTTGDETNIDLDGLVGYMQKQRKRSQILCFPKIINELDEVIWPQTLEAVKASEFEKDRTYYLCISHSAAHIKEGLQRTRQLLEAIRETLPGNLCFSYDEKLPASILNEDRITEYTKNGASAAPGHCYTFVSSKRVDITDPDFEFAGSSIKRSAAMHGKLRKQFENVFSDKDLRTPILSGNNNLVFQVIAFHIHD